MNSRKLHVEREVSDIPENKMGHLSHTYKLVFTLCIGLAIGFSSCKSKKNIVAETAKQSEITDTAEVSIFTQNEQMTIDNAFLEGVKFMMIEDYNTALDIFFEVLQMDVRHAPAAFEISKIRALQNRPNDAEIYAEKAHRLEPKNRFYLENLVYMYRQNHKYDKATASLIELTRMDPQHDDYWIELANSYIMQKKLPDALKIYDSMENRNGVTEEVSLQKIKIYQVLKKEKEIRMELQKLIQNFPNETKYRSILAELNMQAKKYDEAFVEYQKILTKDSANPYIHLALADYYKITKDSAKRVEELVLAFESPLLEVDAKVGLLLSYYEFPERKDETYRLLDVMISRHSEEPKALSLYADFLYRDDRYEDAQKKYREVKALDPSKYLIWEHLLLCDLQLFDTVSLLKDAQDALEIFPEQPLIYYMLGTAYNLKADYAMAMQYYDQGAQLTSGNQRLLAQFYGDLADVYHRLENHEKSDEYFRKALEIEPENTLVLNNFAYYLSLRKEHLDEAEEMAKKTCRKHPTDPTYLDTFAWVLYQRGKYKEAKEIMEFAMKHGGNEEATLLEHFGDILWKNGEKERALDLWKQAKTLNESAASEELNEKIKTESLIEK